MPEQTNEPDELSPGGDTGPGSDWPADDASQVDAAPRRAASAQFVVDAEVGAEAAMREAMDPANQSLAEALRLSFRVLQGVIVVLVILFALSGVKTVEQGQSGVELWFGRVLGTPGHQALEPGLHWTWLPYPAGEFMLVETANREVDLGNRFWPDIPLTQSVQDAIAGANPGLPLRAGKDGFLVLKGGDLAHLKMSAKYQIDRPEQLLARIAPENAARLVELALSRSTVEIAAGLDVQALVDLSDDTKSRIRAGAQAMLDDSGVGLTLTEITVSDKLPAFAIAQVQGDLQTATADADKMIEDVRQKAAAQLIAAAGPNYPVFVRTIAQYDDAVDRGNEQEAATHLASLGELVESGQAAGQIVDTIERAHSHQAEIESTLGVQARLFSSLLDSYRSNPQLVVNKYWLEAYSDVLSHKDTEVVFVPPGIGAATLTIEGIEAAARERLNQRLNAQNDAMMREAGQMAPFIRHGNEIAVGTAGRRLQTKDGKVMTPGEARSGGGATGP